MAKILRDFYIYQLNFGALANGASATDSFNVQADSSFQWTKASYFADEAGAAQEDSTRVIPLVNILITDTGSGRQLMDAAVPISSLFGTGQIPFILQEPKIFAARSTVSVTLTNFSNNTTYLTRISFIGAKLFNLDR